MGCVWSGDRGDRCAYCNRRHVDNLVFVDNICEICIRQSSRPASSLQLRPRFGEYKCSCGRFWTSRLSWARSYQICKRCRKPVYAHSQRELRPSDQTVGKESRQEHQKEFCQMCQQMGRYCGTSVSANRGRKTRYSY